MSLPINISESETKAWLEFLDKTVLDYINQNKSTTSAVKYSNAKELSLSDRFNVDNSVGSNQIKDDILFFLDKSVRTGHPHFHNQLYGGFNFWAFLGEVFTALTSTSMATFEVAPIATLLENTLVNKMSHLVGFTKANQEGEGIMLTGGSNANMVAMLAARNTKFPNSRKTCLLYTSPSPRD